MRTKKIPSVALLFMLMLLGQAMTGHLHQYSGMDGDSSLESESVVMASNSTDSDGDGVNDANDSCPNGNSNWNSNLNTDHDGDGCRDASEDTDDDNDGVLDGNDLCPSGSLGWISSSSTDYDSDGCKDSTEDQDDDNDGVSDSSDSCPKGELGWISSSSTDADGDGCRDSTEDPDGGGNTGNNTGNNSGNNSSNDTDGDGISDSLDDCPNGNSNWTSSSSTDYDGDGCRDSTYEDLDDDNDEVWDYDDLCPMGQLNWFSNSTTDHDSDGCHDSSEDADDDNDGVIDASDQCPLGPINWYSTSRTDADGDGCPDTGFGDEEDCGNDTSLTHTVAYLLGYSGGTQTITDANGTTESYSYVLGDSVAWTAFTNCTVFGVDYVLDLRMKDVNGTNISGDTDMWTADNHWRFSFANYSTYGIWTYYLPQGSFYLESNLYQNGSNQPSFTTMTHFTIASNQSGNSNNNSGNHTDDNTDQGNNTGNTTDNNTDQGNMTGNNTDNNADQGNNSGNNTDNNSDQGNNTGNSTDNNTDPGNNTDNNTDDNADQGNNSGNNTDNNSDQSDDTGNSTDNNTDPGNNTGNSTDPGNNTDNNTDDITDDNSGNETQNDDGLLVIGDCTFSELNFDSAAHVIFYLSWTDSSDVDHCGTIQFELYSNAAPIHTQNFQDHVGAGNYNGVIFHRVIDDFMIQGGDIQYGNGMGGYAYSWQGYCNGQPIEQVNCQLNDYSIPDEFDSTRVHQKGALSMAHAGANTGGSQFFIMDRNDATWLDGVHSVFGQAIAGTIDGVEVTGIEVVDAISQVGVEGQSGSTPIHDVTILSAENIGTPLTIDDSMMPVEEENSIPSIGIIGTAVAISAGFFIAIRREDEE